MWHLSNEVEDRADTLPPRGDSHVITGGHVCLWGGRTRRRDGVWFGKSEVFSFSRSPSYSPIAVLLCTHASVAVISLAAGISLIESSSNKVEKHKLMISWGTMDIFPRRTFEMYVANLSAKPILFKKIWSLHNRVRLQTTLCLFERKR